MTDTNRATKVVQTLVGKASFDLALKCLARMPELCQRPIRFWVHSDGTLDDRDLAELQERLPIERVITAAEAEALVDDRLRGHPNCRRYRDFRHTGRITFDAPLFAEKEMFFADPDVLFNKPFVLHHFWEDREFPFIFMRGEGNAYSVNPWQLARLRRTSSRYRLGLRNRVNAGVICLSKDYYDLDFIEYLLAQPIYQRAAGAAPFWWNQTNYAFLAARTGCGLLDPRQVVVASIAGFSASVFMNYTAVHFTGPYRHHLDGCLARMEAQAGPLPCAEIDVAPSRPYVLVEEMLRSVWRRLRAGKW